MMTAQAQSTETDSAPTDTLITTDQSSEPSAFPDWGTGRMLLPEGYGGGQRGHGRHGFVGMGGIKVSSEYNATVTAILDSDTDVQNIISEGYAVQSIHPIIKTVIEAGGTATTKATTAIVSLQNGTSGFATVKVDVENDKVTEIVIITRTVIDKTGS